ncbi:MAG TPA: hydroxymethylglutaryl-CoA lyase, partial [bacterium]|nr:hydroxymethylglutaryl-CoA lyase [bacterium]
MRLPTHVTIKEVGLRDGLQLVGAIVPTEVKVRLLHALHAAGLRAMEVTSFVSPRAVPQFGDAEAVARAALALPHLRVSALIPNVRGFERARDAGVRHCTVVIGATDRFNERNVRMTVEESLVHLEAIAKGIRALPGASLEVGIAVAFGCPYTGAVAFDAVARIVERARVLELRAISLGDTIGVATPAQVAATVARLMENHPDLTLALHLHDTRGMGLANVLAGCDAGVTMLD